MTPAAVGRGPCEATWTAEGRLALSPLPPLANRLWRRGWVRRRQRLWRRDGRVVGLDPRGILIPVTYKTQEAKDWQEAMALRIREAGLGPVSPEARRQDFRVLVWLFFADRRFPDPDAPIKLLLDTLGTALQVNDRYLLPSIQDRTVDRANPRLELVIEEMSP